MWHSAERPLEHLVNGENLRILPDNALFSEDAVFSESIHVR